MELADAVDHLRTHHQAVLAVVDDEGFPHVTRVVHAFDGEVSRVSLTDGRVKTGHLQQRPRATLHVRGDDDWHYVSMVADVELSAVASDPDGAVVDELLAIYEAVSGQHDDPQDFRRSMVDDHRLVLRLTPRRVYGQL